MKKVLLVFDGQHFSEGAFKMANFLHEQEAILVTGVFLQPIDYRDMVGYSSMGAVAPVSVTPYPTDETVITKNMARFEERCQHAGMEYRTHRDTDMFALQELQKESRFADLMILSAEMFYENIGKDQPNDYLKKILRQTECPILLVPENYSFPSKILLAYDGKPDSVFAIKQFTYLFPQFYNWETKLITLEEEGDEFPHQDLIEELATKHFANLTLEMITDETRKSFHTWIKSHKDYLLVSGAFGRSELSNLFSKSFLSDIITDHSLTVFVAHK
ncbi:MAG: hypothetical protein RLY11_1660 [Bacteroidota bacterium]|jgi:hypothetical protein